MNDKQNQEFKIHLDDGVDEPEGQGKKARDKKAVSTRKKEPKSGGNTSWIPYALIVVLVAAMVGGYMSIRNQLLSVHSYGSQETKHLSEDIDSRFSNLNSKLSDLEKSFSSLSEAQAGFDKSLSSLSDSLSKESKNISGINSSKANKKEVSSSLAEINKQLSSLSDMVKKNTADTAVMSSQLKATLVEVNTITDKVVAAHDRLATDLEAIQTGKASKEDLISEIDHLENVLKASQAKGDQKISNMMQTIQRLEMSISALEAKTGLAGSSGSGASGSITTPNGTPSLPSSSGSPEPGELIERDISN
jgi:septal ring factor EnvC (AmiA/AmiB activator)